MNTEISTIENFSPLSISEVVKQVETIKTLMQKIMKEGEHYGKIPGTDKKTLYQSGAEKIAFIFRIAPEFETKVTLKENGHREYEVNCKMYHIGTHVLMGSGVGYASTMESKYRYRTTSDYEILDQSIPQDYKSKKDEYRKKGLGCKKIGDEYKWVKFTGSDVKIENPDLADVFNTVLKIAEKRAYVSAVRRSTAASDIFMRDGDGDDDDKKKQNPIPPPTPPPPPPPTSQSKQKEIKTETLAVFEYKTREEDGITMNVITSPDINGEFKTSDVGLGIKMKELSLTADMIKVTYMILKDGFKLVGIESVKTAVKQ